MGTCLKSGTPDLAPALSDTGQMKYNISDGLLCKEVVGQG
jgi:hypothetical protein